MSIDKDVPKFFIIGDDNDIMQVLDKLPNKTRLFNNYLFKINEPFIEYGFNLYKNDNNYQIKIIICPKQILNIEAFDSIYFNNATGLIICCNNTSNINNYKKIADSINANENLFIWFDKDIIDNEDKNLHYMFSDTNWINRIYKHIDYPYESINQCNIL